MKKLWSLLLAICLLASLACAPNGASNAVEDGRARPSSCGRLRVVDGKLCSESGEGVMLRGVSTHDLITVESFLNDELFREL